MSDYLNDLELKVFTFILENFLAQCSNDKILEVTLIEF